MRAHAACSGFDVTRDFVVAADSCGMFAAYDANAKITRMHATNYSGRTQKLFRHAERTPDGYVERTPDGYAERTPDGYAERTPDRDGNGVRPNALAGDG